MVKNLPAMQDTQVQSLGQEDVLEKGMVVPYSRTPVFLPGEFHGWSSLVGYSPWGCKKSDTTEQFSLSLYMQPSVFLSISGLSFQPSQCICEQPNIIAICFLSTLKTQSLFL